MTTVHVLSHLVEVTINTVNATLFINYPLLEDILLLRHVSVQSNHLQTIYIGFYENYYTKECKYEHEGNSGQRTMLYCGKERLGC
jgi:hypothetical protein